MDNKRLFGKMCFLHRQMYRENASHFHDYGITPTQMRTLVFVHMSTRRGGGVCQKDVEREVNLRPSSVSTLLANLERDGFIKRTISDGDARTKFIQLTEKGENLCLESKRINDECDAAIQSVLNDSELEQLDNLLTKIIQNISEQKKEVL